MARLRPLKINVLPSDMSIMYAWVWLIPLFFWLGMRESKNFEQKTGRTPWDLPSWAWGLLTGMSLLIGGVLLMIARRTTRPRSQPAVDSGSPTSTYGSQNILPGG
ncbi:MAG: hypothetical protein M3Z02_00030 [Actinomycetota bacterium]|nr:hypothetical protein [Actinomycetota bacterium]